MKKIIAILTVVSVVLLSSCNLLPFGKQSQTQSDSSISDSNKDSSTDYEATAAIIKAFDEAETAYGWFTPFSSIQLDKTKSINFNNLEYYKVDDSRFSCVNDVKTYLKTLFDDATIEKLLNTQSDEEPSKFVDTDFELYSYQDPFGIYQYEINDKSFSIREVNENKKLVTLTIKYTDDDLSRVCEYGYTYEKIGVGWVFTNFVYPYYVVADNAG